MQSHYREYFLFLRMRALVNADPRTLRALASEKIERKGDCVQAGTLPVSLVIRGEPRDFHITNGLPPMLSGPGLLPGIGDKYPPRGCVCLCVCVCVCA